MGAEGVDRREIPQRQTRWAQRAADALYRAKIRPNHISVASVVAALIGTAALVLSATAPGSLRAVYLVLAAVMIPLRLLCNMLDGMLAVEKGLHSPTGDLYNEVPDRIADLALITGAGYAARGLIITDGGLDIAVLAGWIAASAAVGTAYVRSLGAAQGVGNFFNGPTPKPVRMWILMLAALAAMAEPLHLRGAALFVAVVIIGAGSILTIIIRLRRITRALHARADQ